MDELFVDFLIMGSFLLILLQINKGDLLLKFLIFNKDKNSLI